MATKKVTSSDDDIDDNNYDAPSDNQKSPPKKKIINQDQDNEKEWTVAECTNLIQQIRQQLPKNDKLSYYCTIAKLNWSEINIPYKSKEDCQKQLTKLLKKVRHVRILNELLVDVELNLSTGIYDTKRSSAYHIFCTELRKKDKKLASSKKFFSEASMLFKNLSQHELQQYKERADLMNVSIQPKCKKKKIVKPSVFNFYFDDQMKLGNVTDRNSIRKDYSTLSDEEKFKWIKVAMSTENFDKKFLTKQERRILTLDGKPKRPQTALNIFFKQYFAAGKPGDIITANATFKNLPDKEKQIYINQAEASKLKYKRDMASYQLAKLENDLQLSMNEMPSKSMENNDDDDNDADESLLIPKEEESSSEEHQSQNAIESDMDETILQSPLKKHKKRRNISTMSQDDDEREVTTSLTPHLSRHKNRKKLTMTENERDAINQSEQQNTSLKKSKRKTNDESDSIYQSDQSQSKGKKRKNLSMSYNDNDLSLLSSTKIKFENSSPKKSAKKPKKLVEPPKPASSAFEYFQENIYEGPENYARKEYDNLPRDKKKELRKQYKNVIADYMQNLETFLSQLSKDEMIEYQRLHENN